MSSVAAACNSLIKFTSSTGPEGDFLLESLVDRMVKAKIHYTSFRVASP